MKKQTFFPKFWIEIRSSLWFLPGLMVFGAILLAGTVIELDLTFPQELRSPALRPFLNAGADGARGLLTAIASSMITVVGVAFSITIVTLSLASTQYTPRILRNFMRDRANQTVLGVFVGVFAYCLLVLRTVHGGDDVDGSFVPLLAVFVAVILALLSTGFIIFFIHHTAASIQVSYILHAVTGETLAAVDNLFPEELGSEGDRAKEETIGPTPHPVPSDRYGYLQSVAPEELMEFANKKETVLRMERTVGDFVIPEMPIVSSRHELDAEARKELRSMFIIGNFRTIEQDAGFGIRQIVDMATKALSPGINDTSTAVSCLDYLSVILSRIAGRKIQEPYRTENGVVRIVAPRPDFGDYLAKSLDEIRHSAAGNVTVLLQILGTIERVAHKTGSPTRREGLVNHARLTRDLADLTLQRPYDRERINDGLASAAGALQAQIPRLAMPPTD